MPRIDRQATSNIRFARHVGAALRQIALPDAAAHQRVLEEKESKLQEAVAELRGGIAELQLASRRRAEVRKLLRECCRGVVILVRRGSKTLEGIPMREDFSVAPLEPAVALAKAMRRMPAFVRTAPLLESLVEELRAAEANCETIKKRRPAAADRVQIAWRRLRSATLDAEDHIRVKHPGSLAHKHLMKWYARSKKSRPKHEVSA